MQLLQQALPQDEDINNKSDEQQAEIVNGDSLITSSPLNLCKNTQQQNQSQQQQHSGNKTSSSNGSIEHHHHHQLNGNVNTASGSKQQNQKRNAEKENGCLHHQSHNNHQIENNHQPQEIIPNNAILSKSNSTTVSKAANHLNFNNLQSVKNTNTTSYQQIQNGIANPMKELNVNVPGKCSPYKNKTDDHNTYIATANKKEYEKEKIIKDSNDYEETSAPAASTDPPSQKTKTKSDKHHSQYHQTHQPNTSSNNLNSEKKVCEQCQRLEQEMKRIKSEVQTAKLLEQEIRQKYENVKGCLQSKQKECEDLQKQ